MSVKQRVITAEISSGVSLKHGGGIKYTVTSDTGAVSSSDVSGSKLVYTNNPSYGSDSGYLGTGISYSTMHITGCNGGTTKKCWFQLCFNNTSSYDLATVGLSNGINNASSSGTSINFDENDNYSGAFSALSKSLTVGSSYIYLKFLRDDESTSTNGVTLKSSSVITIYMGYEEKEQTPPTTPSNFTISKSSLPPYNIASTTATLSWSHSSYYDHYRIDRKINSNDWVTDWQTTENSSITVQPSNTIGDIYYYRIRAYGLGLNSSYSSTLSLKTELTQAGSPTNLKIGSSTIYYIASPSSSATYTLTWTAPSAGTNNTITSYKILRSSDNSSFSDYTSSTSTSASIAPNTTAGNSYYYKVLPVNKYGTCSNYSDSFQIKTISKPTAATLTSSQSSSTVGANFSVSWNSITAETGSTISYKLVYIVNGSETQISISGTTGTIPVSSMTAGTSFTLKLYTIATATNGGTISNSYTYPTTYTKGSTLSFSNNKVTIYNDNGTADAPYAYNTIKISWNSATSTISSDTIYYTIRYKTTSNDQWSDLVSNLTSTSYTWSSFNNNIMEGNGVTLKIVASTNTGGSAETLTSVITRMTKPVIVSAQMNGISATSIGYGFNYKFDIPSETLNCSVALGYNGLYDSLTHTHTLTESTGTVQGENTKFNIDLSEGKNAATTTMIGALYDKVITQKYVKPEGILKIILSSSSIPECSTTYSLKFTYNFVTNFSSGTLYAGYKQSKTFYNPGDQIALYFTPANWVDASGDTIGATLSYYISGNNNTTTNREPNTIFYDTAPNTRNDINLIYKVVSKIEYADYTQEISSEASSVSIARWSDSDIIYLSSVTKTSNTINGHLILPELLCGSAQYNNINTVTYSLFYTEDDEIIDEYKDVIVKEEDLIDKDISFSFINDTEENISIYAIVKFTNTSLDTITKTSTTYLLRSSGVPLAIRKGRIGINVDSQNFVVDTDEAKVNSALYVASSNDTAPVVEISASSGEVDKEILVCYKGDTQVGKITSRQNDAISIQGLTQIIEDEIISSTQNWTNNIYKITNNYITSNTIQEILPYKSITSDQLKYFQRANFIGGAQGDGYCEIICYGTKPVEDIPITLIIRGG